jgi:hypothetical protein
MNNTVADILEGMVTGVILGILLFLFMISCDANASQLTSKAVYQSLITHEAAIQGLEPAIALAVAEVESNFRPNAVGKHGERGIFQLHPKYHSDFSIQNGVKTLIYWQKVCGSKTEKFVNCYNRGTRPVRNPMRTPYYRKFIKAYQKYKVPPLVAVAD